MSIWDKIQTILIIALHFGMILYSVAAWHFGSGMNFWNWTHSLTFTILPIWGFTVLIAVYKRLEKDD